MTRSLEKAGPGVTFSPFGDTSAGDSAGVVKVWDRRTTKTLAQKETHKTRGDDGVTSLVLLKDHLISGGADSYLMVYSLKDLY